MIRILLIITLLANNVVFAEENKEPIKLGAQYQIEKQQSIDLRITEVPKKYPWIEKDLDGKTKNPEMDSIVVAENVKAIKLKDPYGDYYTLPAGTKFFAKVGNVIPAKSFWRKEKVQLDFFAIAVSDGKYDEFFEETSFSSYNGKKIIQPNIATNSVKLDESFNYNSAKQNKSFKDALKNFGKLGAYTIGGAVAGPVMLFSISSIIGVATSVSALTNPYVLGGSAALGAGVGLVSGIVRKGDSVRIEPGKKLKVSIADTWAITKILDEDLKNKSELVAEKINHNFVLDILKVKKVRDIFGDVALRVSFYYKNKTDLDITYTSFQLIDSMGKAYEANVDSITESFLEELKPEGQITLSFTVDYPNAPHQLKVLSPRRRQTLAYKELYLN